MIACERVKEMKGKKVKEEVKMMSGESENEWEREGRGVEMIARERDGRE